MKKILFMIINMNIGGTEKALLSMLAELPENQYDITVLMLEKSGGFLDSIPPHVHVECLKGYDRIKDALNLPPRLVVRKLMEKMDVAKALKFVFFCALAKITKHRCALFNYLLKDFSTRKIDYDLAVAYAGPMDFITYYVLHKIKAKKKVQWIHFDLSKIYFNTSFARKTYPGFDKVVTVSENTRNQIIEKLPSVTPKTEVFHNITSADTVRRMADLDTGFEDHFTGTRILTVGRLCKEKGQDLTIPVLARLRRKGYNVRWYCIGDGSAAKKEYMELINQYHVTEDYILLGAKVNPYPFMKQCDIYVQPSRHEGYCVTIDEAMCFQNPIVTTNFLGIGNRIDHEKTGLIVECTEHDIYNAIKKLLDNVDFIHKIRENLKPCKPDTAAEIEKLYSMIR